MLPRLRLEKRKENKLLCEGWRLPTCLHRLAENSGGRSDLRKSVRALSSGKHLQVWERKGVQPPAGHNLESRKVGTYLTSLTH